MAKRTLNWIGIAMLLAACAGGEDDDNADTSGSVGESGSGDTSTDPGGTATMTTAPTTAETLSTTASSTTDATATGDTSESGGATEDTGVAEVTCEEYCSVYATSCADHSEYANEEDCLDNCAQWPVGSAADTAADSVGCRLYHATVAGSTDPDMHCPHAGPSGAGMCVSAEAPVCDLYCARYFGNCDGELNAFVDEAECMSECAAWYPGTEADVEGHTIGCHSYHANAAVGDPMLHCPHAGPGGGGVCVL